MKDLFDKFPKVIVHHGECILKYGEMVSNGNFEISLYPQNIQIEISITSNLAELQMSILLGQDGIKMEGETSTKLKVSCNDLKVSSGISNKYIFWTNDDLIFGNRNLSNLTKAQFPLIGYYRGEIDIKIDEWEIKTESENYSVNNQKVIAKNWELQLEGLNLVLKNESGEHYSFLKKAENISLLLSLAVGNSVIFNRQIYFDNLNKSCEIWRLGVNYNFGVKPCIQDSQIASFVFSSLSNLESFNEKKRKQLFSVIDYINSTSKGFLEDRILRLCIAWESLTSGWIKLSKSENRELEDVKKSLLNFISELPISESINKELIKNRVSNSLEWTKLNDLFLSLVSHYQLNSDKLGLDFKTLIIIRNEIAHSGRFRKKYSSNNLIKLIDNHVLALRVILLLELKYSEQLIFNNDGNLNFCRIDQFLIQTNS